MKGFSIEIAAKKLAKQKTKIELAREVIAFRLALNMAAIAKPFVKMKPAVKEYEKLKKKKN